MKKLLFTCALVGLGAGLWWVTARTARFSIKKWDAKFETVLRHDLNELGVSNQDLISSVHEIQKDAKGEWVEHKLSLKMSDPAKQKQLAKELEDAGANVQETMVDKVPTLVVRRGSRIYQEIQFAH